MQALAEARKEMSEVMARARLTKAFKWNVPAAADKDMPIGSMVLLFKQMPTNKCVGPYLVVDVQGKAVLLSIECAQTQVSIDKVKIYNADDQPAEVLEPSVDNPFAPVG